MLPLPEEQVWEEEEAVVVVDIFFCCTEYIAVLGGGICIFVGFVQCQRQCQ